MINACVFFNWHQLFLILHKEKKMTRRISRENAPRCLSELLYACALRVREAAALGGPDGVTAAAPFPEARTRRVREAD